MTERDSETDTDRQQQLEELFGRYDKDGSGRIDRGEFGALIVELGAGLTEAETDRAFADLDRDGDGAIDFAEFSRWWRF